MDYITLSGYFVPLLIQSSGLQRQREKRARRGICSPILKTTYSSQANSVIDIIWYPTLVPGKVNFIRS